MRRRDVPKILLASAAGASLPAERTNAQTCTLPCYPRTAAEQAADVTPSDDTYPPGNVKRYGVQGMAATTIVMQSSRPSARNRSPMAGRFFSLRVVTESPGDSLSRDRYNWSVRARRAAARQQRNIPTPSSCLSSMATCSPSPVARALRRAAAVESRIFGWCRTPAPESPRVGLAQRSSWSASH